jgi:hypothetical protein
MFESEYAKLLDCPYGQGLEYASEASRRGWIDFKMAGEIVEVLFPRLVSFEDIERANGRGAK